MVSKSIHQDQTIEKARISFGFKKLRPSRTASPAKIINGIESELARIETIIEEDDLDTAISPKSSAALFAFFKNYRIDTVPDITLNDNGDLHAVWSFGGNQKLALSFLANDTINFVLFIRRDGSAELSRLWGNDTAHNVYHDTIKHNALSCIQQ